MTAKKKPAPRTIRVGFDQLHGKGLAAALVRKPVTPKKTK